MRIAAICINDSGETAAGILRDEIPGLCIYRFRESGGLESLTGDLFHRYDGIIFFCAAGIAVRMIAPYTASKYSDPAVVAVDNGCRYALSLLSGHEGGANTLAVRIARILAAQPVITTATEARKDMVLGLGSRRGIGKVQVLKAVEEALTAAEIRTDRIRTAATVTEKCREPGLLEALEELHIPLVRITGQAIRAFTGAFEPTAAERHLDVPAVAEPCALLAARDGELVLPKVSHHGVTVALVRERIGPEKLLEV